MGTELSPCAGGRRAKMAAKYRGIVEWIYDRLQSGELRGGDRLESENELSSRLGISRQTVRHAMALLEEEGLLDRVRGSGTYIREGAEKKLRAERPVSNSSGNAAQFLHRGPLSNTVTILSTNVDGYIFPRIIQAMVKGLSKEGYDARILFTENRVEKEYEFLTRLLEEPVPSPLIAEPVMSGLPSPNLDCYRKLQERGTPILFFHSSYEGIDIPCIRMDDVEAGRLAADHLISKGHRRIAGIFKLDDGQGRSRYEGYTLALRSHGIPLDDRRICWIDTLEQEDLPSVWEKIRSRIKGCSACLCYNDEVAHALADCLEKEGKQIPEDLSVVSIDNSQLAQLSRTKLTSVNHPMEELGRKVARNMAGLIRDPSFDASCVFQVELTVRDSVAEHTE